MGLKAGIVGLPNVGKSTMFNAITKKNILAANYPFATIDPNVGVVIVPDKRMLKLEEMYIPERTIPATYEFIDIAGLIKGASKGEGLGNKFLTHIREVDAICEVVRCFDDDNIIHVENTINPIRDIETLEIELMLSDIEIVQARIAKVEKKAITTKDKETMIELELFTKIKDALDKNIPARKLEYTSEEEKILKSFGLLSLKPVIYVANIKEDDLITGNKYIDLVKEYAINNNSECVVMCAKIESELSELNEYDKLSFLKELGIEDSGLDLLIRATYKLLGLATFFTVGSDEVKAWTFKVGMKAPECAGIIHTDFERGFIRAEVMTYEDLIKYGSELKVKEAGKTRLEGKEYIMKDGDICHFRFNV
ncbi:MAG: redox-regulated ATPase YchF [Bacilli bacterium]|nr:redox-regulated ATPase YchF [Bacilli bacterium]